MINPNRYLSISILASLLVTLMLSLVYHYRAFDDLQTARLKTDLVISQHLPEELLAIAKKAAAQSSLPTALKLELRAQQRQLELRSSGLDIVALELLNLQQLPLLLLGDRPRGIEFSDPEGFERATQGDSTALLISPSLFGSKVAAGEKRYIQLSQIGLKIPSEINPLAVINIYSDLTEQVSRIYLTQGLLLGLMLFSLTGLHLFLHRGLRRDKKNVQTALVQDSKASRKADHDALTGLPNRLLLNQRLKQALEHSKKHRHSVVVMFLDLDGFKQINDTLGHHAGDQLLKIVAKRLNDCVREGDTVARFGGDEFVVLLPLFDSRYKVQAPETAQRILTKLCLPMKLQSREVQLSCSIGVSRYPDDGANADTLLKNADTAMYQAKEQGRNNVQFYSIKPAGDMSAPTTLKSSLKQALQRYEFQLLYQPLLHLKTSTLAGISVLLYWAHPITGMDLAEKLLPSGKKNSAALVVGQWLLENACLQRMNWQQQGIDCGPLTIYMKANLFEFELLEETVRVILESTRLKPENLELELTDCLLNKDLEIVLSVMAGLKSLGVRLSIDASEFGSSFIRLLPLDSLRIGQACTNQMLTQGVDSVIARSIIALGHQLSYPVVAEGVDNAKQKAYLAAKGCDLILGQAFSDPLSSVEALKLLRKSFALPTAERSQKAKIFSFPD